MSSDKVLHLNSSNFDSTIAADKPVLVDFWASWCMPCKMQGDVLREFAPSVEGKVKIVKVNVDESEKVALSYGIVSIPTLMVFVGGELKEKTVGLTSSGELSEMLIKYLG